MTTRAEADTVSATVRDGIAWVKFNRPEKRNCMSPKLNRQMLRVLEELEFRDDVGVLVCVSFLPASSDRSTMSCLRPNRGTGPWSSTPRYGRR